MFLHTRVKIVYLIHQERDWIIRSIIIVQSIEGQFIPHSFGPEFVFMPLNETNNIVNYHSFHQQPDWFIRSIIIVRRIEDQFIPHSFEPVFVFMMFHSMNMIINSHSFHEQPDW